jgi:hypothetical protein
LDSDFGFFFCFLDTAAADGMIKSVVAVGKGVQTMPLARILAVLFACLTATVAAGQQPGPHPYAETLHKQAVAIMRNKFVSPLNPGFIKQMSDPIKERLEQGRDFNLMIGPTLTESGKGLYMAVWGDKVFAFNMTKKQNEMAGLRSGGFNLRDIAAEKEVGRTPDMVRLSSFSLDGGTRHKMNQELTGTIKITVRKQFEGKAVLRVSCLAENQRATQYQHFPDGLPDGEEITIRLKSLKSVNGGLLPCPAILFVDLCSTPEAGSKENLTVRSNAVAILIDLLDG